MKYIKNMKSQTALSSSQNLPSRCLHDDDGNADTTANTYTNDDDDMCIAIALAQLC